MIINFSVFVEHFYEIYLLAEKLLITNTIKQFPFHSQAMQFAMSFRYKTLSFRASH